MELNSLIVIQTKVISRDNQRMNRKKYVQRNVIGITGEYLELRKPRQCTVQWQDIYLFPGTLAFFS